MAVARGGYCPRRLRLLWLPACCHGCMHGWVATDDGSLACSSLHPLLLTKWLLLACLAPSGRMLRAYAADMLAGCCGACCSLQARIGLGAWLGLT